jgi:hypothetical protein
MELFLARNALTSALRAQKLKKIVKFVKEIEKIHLYALVILDFMMTLLQKTAR